MTPGTPRIDLGSYVVLPVWYECNNNCSICMLSNLKNNLPPVDYPSFKNLISGIMNHGRLTNLIMSGAEITMFPDLLTYVEYAASLKWFDKIQVQTNGRKLADRNYLRRLIDAGVNEFFISVHGLKDTHDAISGNDGAFSETMEGIRNLEEYDVNVITNTVLTMLNYRDIVSLFTHLCKMRVSEVHLWNFFPMERTDSRDLIVGMEDFGKLLRELLSVINPTGKPLVFKSFPECLSLGEPGFFDNRFPVNIIHDRFWHEFSVNEFGTCVHKDVCSAKDCWGLSGAYIRKYGDERNLLAPLVGFSHEIRKDGI